MQKKSDFPNQWILFLNYSLHRFSHLISEVGVGRNTVWKVLREQQLYPYHIQKVQALKATDYEPRVIFSEWFLGRCNQDAMFLNKVLFTDEAGFTRDGIINFRNMHEWAEDNPHAVVERHHQDKFSINVWAGVIDNYLIGPFVLPNRLNGAAYRLFLENNLHELLDNIPIQIRHNMWFMHDGAPPHYSLEARQHLNERFEGRVIGRGCPVNWPPRSPDLNPMDFFVWGYLKSLVYSSPVETVEELEERVFHHCEVLRNNPEVFFRVRQSMMRRLRLCVETNGRHIEHLL